MLLSCHQDILASDSHIFASQLSGAGAVQPDSLLIGRISLLEAELLRKNFTITRAEDIGEHILQASVITPAESLGLPQLSTFQLDQKKKLDAILNKGLVELSDAVRTQARDKEKIVGEKLLVLLQSLKKELDTKFFIHDTSLSGYLTCPTARVDLTFTVDNHVTWSSVVWMAEVKIDLDLTQSYHQALGQASDRAQALFEQQPQRDFCIIAIIGFRSIEVLRFSRSEPTLRTNRLNLADASSPGASLLLQLFLSAPELHLGYPSQPPRPPSLSLDGHVFTDFQMLRPNRSIRSSSVYSALMDGGDERVVIKFGGDGVHFEASVLRFLQDNALGSLTPRILSSGCLDDGTALSLQVSPYYIIIQPCGRHLSRADSAESIIQVVLDVATALEKSSAVQVNHRDVSPSNIIIYEDRGLLVDFHASGALDIPGGIPLG